jgi:invasion protein IalB
MGFRSLAQSLLLTASIAAAATTPVFAQQQPAPSQAKPPASAPAPTPAPAPQQPSAAKPNVEQVMPGQTQPPAPGTVKSNHGAWSVVCDKPAGAATEQCALMQNVIAEDRPEVGLSVVVLKTADR